MITPTRLTLWLLAALGLVMLGAILEPTLVWVGLAGNAAVIGLCLIEGWVVKRQDVRVERSWPRRVQIDRPARLVVAIENRSRRVLHVHVRQLWPETADDVTGTRAPGRASVRVAPRERVEVTLDVTPRRRGRLALEPIEVDAGLRSGLARYRWRVDDDAAVTVFPDLQSLWAYEKLRRSRALRHMGVHQQRMVGAGRDLDQLREYQPDDDFRDINWKATARRLEPITTVYQAERSRDVLICMDCGRMMGDPVGKGTALDRAVDAAILLAHASTRQGDRVGLMRLSRAVDVSLKPRSGSAAVRSVIEALVHAEPEPVFPAYASLVQRIRHDQSHRALIFVFTSLNDPQLAAELATFIPLLSRRHLVVVVSLRDPLLDDTADGPANDETQLYQALAARRLANERDAHRRALAKAGVHVLEADAQTIQLRVINEYLAIKSRQLL